MVVCCYKKIFIGKLKRYFDISFCLIISDKLFEYKVYVLNCFKLKVLVI